MGHVQFIWIISVDMQLLGGSFLVTKSSDYDRVMMHGPTSIICKILQFYNTTRVVAMANVAVLCSFLSE